MAEVPLTKTSSCANCGAQRNDLYCARCGQNSRNYRRAFPPMLWELLRETFDIDSRLFRTFGLLLFKPGELAAEFSRNRRARYVSPIRLYLFVSLTFFFLLSLNTEIDPSIMEIQRDEQTQAQSTAEDVSVLRPILSEQQWAKAQRMASNPDSSFQRQLVNSIAQAVAEQNGTLSPPWRFFTGQAINAAAEPAVAVNKVLDNLPIAMFLLLPVFALLLSVIYFRRRLYYVEHLVFATHLHTFSFLVYSVMLLLPEQSASATEQSSAGTSTALLLLVLLIYHVVALKRYYGGGFWSIGFTYVIQMMLYFLILVPTAAVTVFLISLATV